jgi:hypothetical protein
MGHYSTRIGCLQALRQGKARLAPVPARILVVSLAAVALLAAGCSGGGSSDERASGTTSTTTAAVTTKAVGESTATGGDAATIALFVSDRNTGPWRSQVSLKLRRDLIPRNFFVCGIAADARPATACTAPAGTGIPAGTILRLEQRPAAPAAPSPDSPGWGTVGTSQDPTLSVPLSNFVSGNVSGTIRYRVTLRPIEGGAPLATSNVVTVTWHE